MAILAVYSKAEEFGFNPSFNSTLANSFDSNWCTSSIVRPTNTSGPFFTSGLPNQTNLWFHWECYAANAAASGIAADGHYWTLSCNSTSASRNFAARANLANGELSYSVSESPNFSGSSTSVSVILPHVQSLQTYDVNVRLNDPVGLDTIDIYHNGILFYTATEDHTRTLTTGINGISFDNNDTESDYHYSQMIIADESTIGMKLARMDPDSVGNHSQWSGDWSALLNPFDGQSISSGVAGERESWNLEAYPGPVSSAGLRSVLLSSVGAVGPNASVSGFRHLLDIGGTVYNGADFLNPTPGRPSITEWTTNPATGLAWNTADFANLIAGVETRP